MELMAAESAKVQEPEEASVESRLQYLLQKSEVFAHFLAGSVAATTGKKGKKGKSGRGKKGRMTEAEEDAQMLKSAQSKRRVVRLDKQPSILADHCKMHGYQLEGLNWLIKLHCNGINGILADEVCEIRTTRRKSVNCFFSFPHSLSGAKTANTWPRLCIKWKSSTATGSILSWSTATIPTTGD